MAKRIIPCLDLKDGRVVKGVNFVNLKDACDPFEAAVAYDKQGADELVFLNIDGSDNGRSFIVDLLKRVKKEVNIPITVGGGIGKVEHIREFIDAGADKVSINSAAVKKSELLAEAAKEFGSDKIVLAIDVTKSKSDNASGYDVLVDGGKVNTGIDAVGWAVAAVKLGAGAILPTSLDADGAKTGYDLEITRLIADATGVPVIASGGAGKKEDFLDAFTKGHADAALAASLFHFGELNIGELKEYLHSNGIDIR